MRVEEQSKVLIVDDEPDVCYLFDRILLKRNLKTGYAFNLAEATLSYSGGASFHDLSG